MKPAPFEFRRPSSVAEAIALVAGHSGFAKFLAGGQTMGPMINLRLIQPDLLVDISRVDELRAVAEKNGSLLVGAATRHAAFEDEEVPDVANGLLRRAASGIAYRAIRNRGTIGGSLAHADPAAEWPTVMMALGAVVNIHGPAGRRSLPIGQFLLGPMTTALADDEVIETVEIPKLSRKARWGMVKRCRKVGEFAYALAVVVLDRERGACNALMGATAGVPLYLPTTSKLLAEQPVWRDGIETEIRLRCEADIDAAGLIVDEYDRQVHGITVIRAAKEALQYE
jgi:carbon-monoxide dehydrogenase medium subunit